MPIPQTQQSQIQPQPSSRFTDFSISFGAHPVTGDVVLVTGINDVVQSMMNLVQLNRYEVPYHSEIGSGVTELLFELGDALTADRIQTAIEDVITNFEPRAQLLQVLVTEAIQGGAVGFDVTIVATILNNTNPISVNTFLKRVR